MNAAGYPIAIFGALTASVAYLAATAYFSGKRASTLSSPVSISLLGIALAFSIAWISGGVAQNPMSAADPFFEWIRPAAITPWWVSAVLLALLCGNVLTAYDTEPGATRTDRLLLLNLSGIGAVSLVATSHLMVALVAWELTCLPLTLAMAATPRTDRNALVSVFFADAFSFILMALGVTLIFSEFQTLSIDLIYEALNGEAHEADTLLYVGTGFWLVGMLTRIGGIPFQLALYDRLASGPASIAGYAGFFLPLAALGFGWGFLGGALRPTMPQWHEFLSSLALLTLWAGSVGMLVQSSWRAFFAHALIAQAGWAMLAMVTLGPSLESDGFLLITTNMLALCGVLFGILFLERNGGTRALELSRGLLRQRPAVALAMITGYLTLAGLPPTAGFISRAKLLFSVAADGRVGVAFLAALSIAAAAYPCLKRLAPLVDFGPEVPEWVRPGTLETLFFGAIALLLWWVGLMPSIAWPG